MKNIDNDIKFSKELLELSSLREAKNVSSEYVGHYKQAHGALVNFENGNILYDLRSYNHKPIFGHGHPLYIRHHACLLKLLKENSLGKSQINDELFLENDFFKLNDPLTSSTSLDTYFINFYFNNEIYIVSNSFFQIKEIEPLKLFLKIFLIEGGRLNVIQEKINKHLRSLDVQIDGNFVSFKNKNSFQKTDLVKYNLFTNDDNFNNESISLYIPVSVTNDQLDDMLKNIIKIIKA